MVVVLSTVWVNPSSAVGGAECPRQQKICQNQEKEGKVWEKSGKNRGKEGKIRKVLSLCPS